MREFWFKTVEFSGGKSRFAVAMGMTRSISAIRFLANLGSSKVGGRAPDGMLKVSVPLVGLLQIASLASMAASSWIPIAVISASIG